MRIEPELDPRRLVDRDHLYDARERRVGNPGSEAPGELARQRHRALDTSESRHVVHELAGSPGKRRGVVQPLEFLDHFFYRGASHHQTTEVRGAEERVVAPALLPGDLEAQQVERVLRASVCGIQEDGLGYGAKGFASFPPRQCVVESGFAVEAEPRLEEGEVFTVVEPVDLIAHGSGDGVDVALVQGGEHLQDVAAVFRQVGLEERAL